MLTPTIQFLVFFQTVSGQMWVRFFFEKNRHGHLPLDSLNWDTPKDLKTERLGAIQYAAVYGRN